MAVRMASRRMLAGLALALGAACDPPATGQRAATPPPGPSIAVTNASVDATGHVVASYTIVRKGVGVSAADAAALKPTWVLAGLATEPVAGLPAWRSYLLTGGQTLAQLPVAGPGTPPALVQQNVKQPGSETGGTVQDLGGGKFTYTFLQALPAGFDPGETLRVGVWLAGTTGTRDTTCTLDFVPNGGPVQADEVVVDANCNQCHGAVQAHGGYRTGVRICVTCHTWQNADPDTIDPAAMAGATPATDPNPLELGRLVHRIHRGKNLPTLYTAAATQANATRANIALPFNPARNVPLAGQKYSIIGYQQRELVFGAAVTRTDNGQPAKLLATGVRYPQDLRNCDRCHGAAAQGGEHLARISRRTCQGCHPDVWYGTGTPDAVHFAHPGGPQADDTQCVGCHLPTPAKPVVDAPIAEVHTPIAHGSRYSGLTATIVAVSGMQPGQHPRVVFTLEDRDGVPSPLGAPTPATDALGSPVPRKLERVAITLSGPTAPDYVTGNNLAGPTTAPITEAVPLTATGSAAAGFAYTFNATMPANAAGTWGVAIEARRTLYVSPFYDAATDTFPWPYTGEMIEESADNPIAYVDVATGTSSGPAVAPRRTVVERERCNGCHLELGAHGELRHAIEYCVMCHAPDTTDWGRRPKGADGNTARASTYDGIEERSVHFKVMIHRIHTGGRSGSAELDVDRPFLVYGYPGGASATYFFDDVLVPVLANCTVCHAGTTYAPESVPAGSLPTVANETSSIQHAASPAHGATETRTPPIQAACRGCHDTGAAQVHAALHTTSAGEQCAQCHRIGGSMSVKTAHGLP